MKRLVLGLFLVGGMAVGCKTPHSGNAGESGVMAGPGDTLNENPSATRHDVTKYDMQGSSVRRYVSDYQPCYITNSNSFRVSEMKMVPGNDPDLPRLYLLGTQLTGQHAGKEVLYQVYDDDCVGYREPEMIFVNVQEFNLNYCYDQEGKNFNHNIAFLKGYNTQGTLTVHWIDPSSMADNYGLKSENISYNSIADFQRAKCVCAPAGETCEGGQTGGGGGGSGGSEICGFYKDFPGMTSAEKKAHLLTIKGVGPKSADKIMECETKCSQGVYKDNAGLQNSICRQPHNWAEFETKVRAWENNCGAPNVIGNVLNNASNKDQNVDIIDCN